MTPQQPDAQAEAERRAESGYLHYDMEVDAFVEGAKWQASRPAPTSEPRHFAPYGSTNALCDETVPRRVAWDATTGEYADARFTVKRDLTTCADCRWRMTGLPAPTSEDDEPAAWLVEYPNGDTFTTVSKPASWPSVRTCTPLYRRPAPSPTVTPDRETLIAAIEGVIPDDLPAWRVRYSERIADAVLDALPLSAPSPTVTPDRAVCDKEDCDECDNQA